MSSIEFEFLDSSTKKEKMKIILGRTILLKIVPDQEKQAILSGDLVKKFVSTTDLCHDDVRSLVDNLMLQEAILTAPSFVQTLIQNKEKIETLAGVADWFQPLLSPIAKSKLFRKIESESSKEEGVIGDLMKNLMKQEDYRSDFLRRTLGRIDKKQLRIDEKQLLVIDKDLEKKTGLKLLIPSTLFICSKCKAIVWNQAIAAKKCFSCNATISDENIERIPISKIPDEIKRVWQSNLWFEAYFSSILRRLGCKTWTSVHAMGASGVLHEVDVLAIRKGTVHICECKTGKVTRNQVFNFCIKASDLRAHISILALIGKLPEPETREFLNKYPSIITLENMGQRREVDIIRDLKKALSKT